MTFVQYLFFVCVLWSCFSAGVVFAGTAAGDDKPAKVYDNPFEAANQIYSGKFHFWMGPCLVAV